MTDHTDAVELPQPAAWRHSSTHDLHDFEEEVQLADADSRAEPLFTEQQVRQLLAEQERKPLTDEQIEGAIRSAVKSGDLSWLGFKKDESGAFTLPSLSPSDYQAARAIERAHGITGSTPE